MQAQLLSSKSSEKVQPVLLTAVVVGTSTPHVILEVAAHALEAHSAEGVISGANDAVTAGRHHCLLEWMRMHVAQLKRRALANANARELDAPYLSDEGHWLKLCDETFAHVQGNGY